MYLLWVLGDKEEMTEFLTIGEPLVVLASQDIDLTLEAACHFTKYLAGAELNVALGICRLGHTATYVSKVGSDPFGRFIHKHIGKAGIDTMFLNQSDDLTGFYMKQKVSQGDPAVAYFRKNSAASKCSADEIASINLSETKLAHLSGIFPAISQTALEAYQAINTRLNAAGVLTVFDPNIRQDLWENKNQMIQVINDLAKNSQIILPGINEGEILMGSRDPQSIADFYLNQSALTQVVIVKLGEKGAFVKQKTGDYFTVPGFEVDRIVDTVGAGDGFAVGLESALLEGKTLREAVKRACAIGALAVQSPGDNDGYPTHQELTEFYNQNKIGA